MSNHDCKNNPDDLGLQESLLLLAVAAAAFGLLLFIAGNRPVNKAANVGVKASPTQHVPHSDGQQKDAAEEHVVLAMQE